VENHGGSKGADLVTGSISFTSLWLFVVMDSGRCVKYFIEASYRHKCGNDT